MAILVDEPNATITDSESFRFILKPLDLKQK